MLKREQKEVVSRSREDFLVDPDQHKEVFSKDLRGHA